MLTFEDCLGLCDLSEEEICAIAEHERLPEITALEYGEYLVHTPDGERKIKNMILEDIEHSKKHGNTKHTEFLESVLMHFLLTHPKLNTPINNQTT